MTGHSAKGHAREMLTWRVRQPAEVADREASGQIDGTRCCLENARPAERRRIVLKPVAHEARRERTVLQG